MLFQSFTGSHRSGVSACNHVCASPPPGRRQTAAIQLLGTKQPESSSESQHLGYLCSCICFVFCGKRMVWTKPARNTGVVQICPSLSYSLTSQCLMKQLLPSPLPSALLTDNFSLGGRKSLFSFSHPDLTLIKTKMGARTPTYWQDNSAALLFVLGQKLATPPIITTESLYSKNLTNRYMMSLTWRLLSEFYNCLHFFSKEPHILPSFSCLATSLNIQDHK